MKKGSLALMLLLAITGVFTSVYASDGADDSMNNETEQHSSMDDGSSDDSSMDDSRKEPVTKFNVSDKKRKSGESMENKRPPMPQLTEDQKAQLEVLKTEFKAALEEIKKAMDSTTTADEKKALMEKMKTLMEEHKKKMQEIAPMMGEMHDKMKDMPKMGSGSMMNDETRKKMEDMFKKKMGSMSGSMMNDEMKKKMQEMMKNGTNGISMEGGEKTSGKGKYKEMFAKKLAGKLEGMTLEKLQSVMEKLETTEAKIVANTSMDEKRKAKLLAQLAALKDLVREAIDQKDTESELNLDEIFQ